jgi:hypothetical protein
MPGRALEKASARGMAGIRRAPLSKELPWGEDMERRKIHWVGGMAVGALLAASGGVVGVRAQEISPAPPCGIALKLLVVSADGAETVLPAIRQTLEYLGTPYDLFVASTEAPLTAARLTTGCAGRYQGVILTTGELAGAFSADEFAVLEAYEAGYGVRRVVWYTYPIPTLGWWWPSFPNGAFYATPERPVTATFTPEAATVFTHVNRSNPLKIVHANVYRAASFDAATVPLLVDNAGYPVAAMRTDPATGRQTLALTFDSNQYLSHNLVLGYDLVNWVTKGIFLGERHAYLSPQVDDLFLQNQMWSPATACGTPVDSTTGTFRLTGADYTAVVNWQRKLQTAPLTSRMRLTMAFNGEGANGIYKPDTLTPAVNKYLSDFHFVSHTWNHPMFDVPYTFAQTATQVLYNAAMALKLKLPIDFRNLVTPNVSGLRNPEALRAMVASGVRYVVTDTSQPGYGNPTPNTGLWNEFQPKLFMIPRYPTNLYFNVSTPEEWVAEYNCVYASYWGRNLTYEEILGNISDTMVTYLLKGDLNLLMFHQPNLRAYNGKRSLLGDLIDMTIAKYSGLVTFPIVSPTMHAVGDQMIARQTYDQAGVTAMLVPGLGLVISVAKTAVVPVTGLNIVGAEQYAGQPIAYIAVAAGKPKTIRIPVGVR